MSLKQKAAMFGLDARIALAIFGALSVISGASLYSAIQNASAERSRQDLEGLIKANEQYYLDNGKQLNTYAATTVTYISHLVVNTENLPTWRGPYIPNASSSSNLTLRTAMGRIIGDNTQTRIALRPKSAFITNDANQYCSPNNLDCAEYIDIYSSLGTAEENTNIERLFNRLDSLVDNGDGSLAGKVRLLEASSRKYLLYRGIMRKWV